MAQFFYHLKVILHALLYALRLEFVAYVLEIVHLGHEVVLYLPNRRDLLVFCGNEKVGREYLVFVKVFQRMV